MTNGMSEYARDGENINGGLLVNVTPEDFGSGHPLAGIAFQRRLEGAAYRLGGGYTAPCQRVEDFLLRRPSTGCGSVRPSFRPGVRYADLHECLPEFITQALEQALPILDKKLPGFAHGDALLTAVESRSSAPVRIPRDDNYESNIRGVFPCGEGAGYAGGIPIGGSGRDALRRKNSGEKSLAFSCFYETLFAWDAVRLVFADVHKSYNRRYT